MSGYTLTERHRHLLRELVNECRSSGTDDFTWLATIEGCFIVIGDGGGGDSAAGDAEEHNSRKRISTVSLEDIDRLAATGMISAKFPDFSSAKCFLRQRAFDAVAADSADQSRPTMSSPSPLSPPPPPLPLQPSVPSPLDDLHVFADDGVGDIQVRDAAATANRSGSHEPAAPVDPAELLPALLAIQSRVSETESDGLRLGSALQDLIIAIRLMREDPHEGRTRWLAVLETLEPLVDLANTIGPSLADADSFVPPSFAGAAIAAGWGT